MQSGCEVLATFSEDYKNEQPVNNTLISSSDNINDSLSSCDAE